MKHTGLIEQLKAARAALSAAIRAAEAEEVKDKRNWKERCMVVEADGGLYDVRSPCGGYWWSLSLRWVRVVEGEIGIYYTAASARRFLAACTVPPSGEGGR